MARDSDSLLNEKWADGGDTSTPESEGLDRNEGWDISFSTPGGPAPQRTVYNELFKEITAMLVEINSKGGFLDYDSTTINYVVGAGVKGSDNVLYFATAVNGPATVTKDPTVGANRPGFWISFDEKVVAAAGSPLTTKGDLFTFDTADARLPVGANDETLIADSAQSLGVKWGIPVPVGQGVAKAWVNFNGEGTLSVRDSFNITSVVDNGTGLYTVNWDTDFPNTNYAITFGGRRDDSGGSGQLIINLDRTAGSQAAGSVKIRCGTSSGNTDFDIVTAVGFGD